MYIAVHVKYPFLSYFKET